MDHKIEITVIGSECQVTEYYETLIKKVAQELGVTYSIIKVIDPSKMGDYAVKMGCLMGYCPGCNFLDREEGVLYTPALFVNGKIRCHSRLPSKEELVNLLGSINQKA